MADLKMGWEEVTGTLAANDTDTVLTTFNLEAFKPSGFFSAELTVTGSGTMKLEYEVSNAVGTGSNPPADATFVTPSLSSDIVTAHTSATGTSGTDFYQFPAAGEPIFAKWIRIVGSETGGANSVTYTLRMNVQ